MNQEERGVVHATFSPLGGAGAVAQRLAAAQQALGWNAKLCTLATEPFTKWARRHPGVAATALVDFLVVRRRSAAFFTLYRQQHSRLHAKKLSAAKGIVHLHWLPGFLNVGDLLATVGSRRIVWSIQDFFPFTGGCHYSYGCEKYAQACSGCPQVRAPFQNTVQRSHNSKRQAIATRGELVLVAPTRWAQTKIAESSAMRHLRCEVIPNPIDTKAFSPGAGSTTRGQLRIPQNAFVIGVGAADLRDRRKQIGETLEQIAEWRAAVQGGRPIHVIVFGDGKLRPPDGFNGACHFLGGSGQQRDLVNWYRAMDVLVSLSQFETFGNTLAEAAACGTASVCSTGSGMSEVVDAGSTGMHVSDNKQLGDALALLYHDPVCLQRMGLSARERAVKEFDSEVVAKQFIKIYQDEKGARPG